jgi:hypothetical protein
LAFPAKNELLLSMACYFCFDTLNAFLFGNGPFLDNEKQSLAFRFEKLQPDYYNDFNVLKENNIWSTIIQMMRY